MHTSQKDKRTKEQLLKTLEDALSQEEILSERIRLLETQLSDCQKNLELSRNEINLYGIPSTKMPFRLDYYKTTDDGPLKGIIEHLPSRQKRSFKGTGFDVISEFLLKYIQEDVGQNTAPALRAAYAPPPLDASGTEPATSGRMALIDRLKGRGTDEQAEITATRKNAEPAPADTDVEPFLTEFSILPGGGTQHSGSIGRHQPFGIQLPLQDWPEYLRDDRSSLMVEVRAINLETGEQCWLHTGRLGHLSAAPLLLPLDAHPLPTGAYKISLQVAQVGKPRPALAKANRTLMVLDQSV